MPKSRFQLLPQPLVAPAKCVSCGSGTKPVIDFGVNIDWHGAVYFCVDCLTEAGVEIGLVRPDEYQKALRELATVVDTQHEVAQRIKAYNDEQLAASERLHSDIDLIYGFASGDRKERIEFSEDTENLDRESEPVTRKSSKSSGKQGPSSVSGNRSNKTESFFEL